MDQSAVPESTGSAPIIAPTWLWEITSTSPSLRNRSSPPSSGALERSSFCYSPTFHALVEPKFSHGYNMSCQFPVQNNAEFSLTIAVVLRVYGTGSDFRRVPIGAVDSTSAIASSLAVNMFVGSIIFFQDVIPQTHALDASTVRSRVGPSTVQD